jgi:hypothetical protein
MASRPARLNRRPLDAEVHVKSLLLSLLVVVGCASDELVLRTSPATSSSSAPIARSGITLEQLWKDQHDLIPDVCGAYPDLSSLTDPSELSRLVVSARLFLTGGAGLEGGVTGETWLRGTDGYCAPCEKCEDAATKGLYRLAELNTQAAAREAAAIALDPRMEWDGGPALLMEDAVSRFGPLVVPYLEPHEKTSFAAAHILECVRRRVPCL